MKVAVVSESSADESVIWMIAESILQGQHERLTFPPLRSRGWPSITKELPAIIWHLHYQSECESLITVVDSDKSPSHLLHSGHIPEPLASSCRYCQLRTIVDSTLKRLKPVQGKRQFQVAVGLAIPSIEAWYLASTDKQISEITWQNAIREGRVPYDVNELKRLVYGTDRPTLGLETEKAIQFTGELIVNLERLHSKFANGYGVLYNEIQNWIK